MSYNSNSGNINDECANLGANILLLLQPRGQNVMQIAEVYCENGPLHGRTMALKEFLDMQLRDGFYIRNEYQPLPAPKQAPKQKIPMYLWVRTDERKVEVQAGDDKQDVTVDSARIDRHGVTFLRLRKIGIINELYDLWKETADRNATTFVVFRGERYKGRTDVVGKNVIDGYMFLQFQGEVSQKPLA